MAEADIWKLQRIKEGFEGRLCPLPLFVSGEEGAKCIHIFRNDKLKGQMR
jgi:hypothetical protein